MKILHVITGLNNGGAEAALFRLAAFDQKSGNRHFVISLMGRGIYADRLEKAGCVVQCLDMPRTRITFRGLVQLYRCMKILRPDVVQTWMYHANLIGGVIARCVGVRAVVWGIHQSNLDRDKNSLSTLLVIKASALLSAYVPARIACCSAQAVPLHRRVGFAAARFAVIPNGYDLDEFRPCNGMRREIRQSLGLEKYKLIIGMVARFDPLKDHRNLLEALKVLKQKDCPFFCLLAGPDMTPENQKLARLVKEAGLDGHVALLGPRNDVPALMNALDLHVLSSAGEAFPNVLAEAMACGTPCVTTNVGDAALIVGDTGWVVPPRCASALANAIMAALAECAEQPLSWQRRQDDGRNRVARNFSLGKMATAYRSLWNVVAGAMETCPRTRQS